MLKTILDTFKNHPAALTLFVALVATTWLYYDVHEHEPLTRRELLGAALFWALLVLAGSSVRGFLARRRSRSAKEPAAGSSNEPSKES